MPRRMPGWGAVVGWGAAVVLWGLVSVGAGAAEDAPAATEPEAGVAAEATEAEIPESALTGEQIYDRVLDNRFYAYEQELVMESGDRSQNTQKTRLEMKYLSFRGAEDGDRFVSKSIAKYTEPTDARHLGYLVIKKTDGGEDQFVYRPSARRVRRINLRGEAVFGTDFSMEDVFPREVEDATYQRVEDSEVDGVSVFVVDVFPKPEKDSEYNKFKVFVEKDHYVALRTQYWDEYDEMFKELNAERPSIRMFEGKERSGDPKQIWVPTHTRMTQLKTGSYTDLEVVTLRLDTKLRDRDFSQRELTRSR